MQSISLSETFQISEAHANLLKNTIVTGISVCILINAEVAIICMVANAVFSLLTENEDKIQDWFKTNKAAKHLKMYWENSFPLFTVKLVMVVVYRIFGAAAAEKQTVVKILVESLKNPALAAWWIFRACVIAPIIEEIIFRGFLQEKLRNMQVFVFGPKAADSDLHKSIRVAVQAILFGLAHVRPEQAAINGIVFLFTGIVGAYNGYLKEETSTLWVPMAFHAHVNSSTAVAVIAEHLLAWNVCPELLIKVGNDSLFWIR